jgi:hypothetical protein
MWLTTSKHADTKLKRAAHALAAALPGGTFIRRGEQGLQRLEELAAREAEGTILVMSKPDGEKNTSLWVLRSRGRDRDTDRWSWAPQEMLVEKMENGKEEAAEGAGPGQEDEPYRIEAAGTQAAGLARFLGLADHALSPYYEEPVTVEVKIGQKGRLEIRIKDTLLTTLIYRMRALCQKE